MSATQRDRDARRSPLTHLRKRPILVLYAILLLASHAVILVQGDAYLWDPSAEPAPPGSQRITVTVLAQTRDGETPGTIDLGFVTWQPTAGAASSKEPVLFLHGSPSSGGADFDYLAPIFAAQGRTVYAMDRPGYGRSPKRVPDHSVRADAHYALAAMDALGIERAHVVGWSYSGSVALWIAHLRPQRCASLTLIAGMGMQETEASGDFALEQIRYRLWWAGLVALPELLPHFGVLGPRAWRHALWRDFQEMDLRLVSDFVSDIDVPTLLLHGRFDPLVFDVAAELHHLRIPNSRLVMLDASHFFVMGPVMGETRDSLGVATRALGAFFDRHDDPDAPPLPGSVDLRPVNDPDRVSTLNSYEAERPPGWTLALLALVLLLCLISDDLAIVVAALCIVTLRIDFIEGLLATTLGVLLGNTFVFGLARAASPPRVPFVHERIPDRALARWGRAIDARPARSAFRAIALPGARRAAYLGAGVRAHRPLRFLAWSSLFSALWTPIVLIAAALLGLMLVGIVERSLARPIAVIVTTFVLLLLLRLVKTPMTRAGRQRRSASVKRLLSPEFWPGWAFYGLLVPWIVVLAIRHRAPTVFTCVNGAITPGGGMIGESKTKILDDLDAPPAHTLARRLIKNDADAATRASRAFEAIHAGKLRPIGENIGEADVYPVILKPDVAQRGYGLRLAKSDDDVRAYLQRMQRDVQIQAFHAGPLEAGVFWMRHIQNICDPSWRDAHGRQGHVFSITKKIFPYLEGDGVRTIEALINDHPRFRMQARIFVDRFEDADTRVLAEGERLRLAQAGNHAQGTMFLDGSDLRTPALVDAIERISTGMAVAPDGRQGLDFGRYDIRYTSDEELRAGRGFAIVELNGAVAESTNIYDPSFPVWRTYATLSRQWATLFRMGSERRAQGRTPIPAATLWRMFREDRKARPRIGTSD